MKRKILATLLVATMGMSLAACGSGDNTANNTTDDSAQTTESQESSADRRIRRIRWNFDGLYA